MKIWPPPDLAWNLKFPSCAWPRSKPRRNSPSGSNANSGLHRSSGRACWSNRSRRSASAPCAILNAVPLTRGLEDEIILATPAQLAEMLQRDELDAGLVSITEVLFHDRYDILDTIAIASLGEVQSVFLAHRRPLEEVGKYSATPLR